MPAEDKVSAFPHRANALLGLSRAEDTLGAVVHDPQGHDHGLPASTPSIITTGMPSSSKRRSANALTWAAETRTKLLLTLQWAVNANAVRK
jgi:hypothetical protein